MRQVMSLALYGWMSCGISCLKLVYFIKCLLSSVLLHAERSSQQVLLLCVPNFDLTQSCALVDLETLQCRQISFRASSLIQRPNPDLSKLGLLDFTAKEDDQGLVEVTEERGVTMMQELDDSDDDMGM